MTRTYQTGYETGDLGFFGHASYFGNAGSVATPTLVTASPTPRSGTYCLKCGWNDTNNNDGSDSSAMRRSLDTLTEVWYSFGLQMFSTSESASAYVLVFRNFDSAGNQNLALRYDDGTLRLYRANAAVALPTQAQLTLLGSSATPLPQSTWALVEIHHVCATGATGTVEVWLNGVQVINVTSAITCPANANAADVELAYRRVGGPSNSCSPNCYAAFDDFRVNSTAGSVNNGRPGDESIILLKPNGAGDLTQLTRGGTDSGANWSQMDEVPAGVGTDYVYGSAAGLTDLYNITTVTVASISALTLIAQVANAGGGGGTVYLPTKTPAGQADGAVVPLTASWSLRQRIMETDPADSAAWTQAKLDALQIGLKIG